MAGLTLDAGALIAAERNDRRFWTFWRVAMSRDVVPTVPATALAQVWRGSKSARLAQILAWCEIDALDEPMAKRTGLLLGRSRTVDIVDASVVAGALLRGDYVLTTDPDDLSAFGPARGRPKILDLRELPARSSKKPRRRR